MRNKSIYKNKMNNCDPVHSVFSLAISFAFSQTWFKLLYIISISFVKWG